ASAFQVCTLGCQTGLSGNGDSQLAGPRDLAISPDDSIYVADTANARIQRFSPAPAFVSKWGSIGSAGGQFNDPNGVGTAPDGSVYVGDTGNNRVQKFTADGQFLFTFGWGVQDGASTFETCSSGCQSGIDGGN